MKKETLEEKENRLAEFMIGNLIKYKNGKLSEDKVEYLNKNLPNWVSEYEEELYGILLKFYD